MMRQHIGALGDQGICGGAFLARIEPAAGPDHLHLRLWIHRCRRQCHGVDALHDLRDRERRDIADDARLRHVPGNQPGQRAPFVEAGGVGGDIFSALVAGGVFKAGLRELLGNLQGRVHVAE